MEYTRSHRVGEQIQKEVSTLLLKGLKDPRVEFVTITAVEVTSDLHLARIFFTAMGDDDAKRNTEEGLKSAIPYIRRELGRRLRMRYIPEIVFKYDTSLEYGSRIESLLKTIHSEENDGQGDPDEN